MEFPKPTPEHDWLRSWVGEWTAEMEGHPASDWRESVRAIGEIWIQSEGRGDMPGGETATTLMTVGFNPKSGRFVGSWIGSMMNHHWVYEGELDSEQRNLTLFSEGPSFTGGEGLQQYKDVFEMESRNVRILRAYVQGEDGAWSHFMTTKYVRVT